jgi:hypothetical protein
MNIDINKNEAWKIIDALKAYKDDYALTAPVIKIIDTLNKKLKVIIDE